MLCCCSELLNFIPEAVDLSLQALVHLRLSLSWCNSRDIRLQVADAGLKDRSIFCESCRGAFGQLWHLGVDGGQQERERPIAHAAGLHDRSDALDIEDARANRDDDGV